MPNKKTEAAPETIREILDHSKDLSDEDLKEMFGSFSVMDTEYVQERKNRLFRFLGKWFKK